MNWLESRQVHSLPLVQVDATESAFSLAPAWSWPEKPLLPGHYPHLINPVLVQRWETGFRIVSGFRRFLSARSWGLEAIPALLAAADWPEPDLMALVIAENRAHRDLSTLEMATVAGKLRHRWRLSAEAIRQEFLPLFGLPPEAHHLRRLLRLAALPEILQRGLGRVEEEILLGISAWPAPDQEFLLELLSRLKLGRNRQMQFWRLLDELRDLRGRSESCLPQIWEEAGCRAIEQEETLSPADRQQGVWQALRKLRYPRLTELEAQQLRLTRALTLPAALQLMLPPFFEGDRIEFRFSARGTEELERVARALLDAGRRNEMAELFELL